MNSVIRPGSTRFGRPLQPRPHGEGVFPEPPSPEIFQCPFSRVSSSSIGAIAFATQQLNFGIDFESGTRVKAALAVTLIAGAFGVAMILLKLLVTH